ncbi:ferric reductase-like transmembrane domain-containing protein [Gordonia sputi]|uniref:ferric reductase-like transmembrane domain-containing protein n=1 Tax=Gordonia sputi TaxID=36823 RepID=UPI003694E5CB
MSGQWLWYASRAAGIVSLLMFTAVLVLGVVTAGTTRGRRSATATVIHRSLAVSSLVFLACHVLTAVLDTYVDIGWLSLVVPFASGYERYSVGLGTIALDVGLTVIVTSLLRHRIPERAWRAVHFSAYAMALFAVIHALFMSSSDQPVLTGISITCTVTIVVAAAIRLGYLRTTSRTRRLELVREWT